MTNQPEFNPRKRDAIQHLKEQLKIKTLELRKALSEKGKLSKNIKNLISYSQGEIKKLKITIKAKDKKIEDQESIAWAARMSRHIGKISGAIKSAPPGKNEPDRILPARPDDLTEDINTLLKRTRLLRKKLEEERETNKKLQIQKEDLTLEINQLRRDSPSAAMKKKLDALKSSLDLTRRTVKSSGIITQDLVREKDLLIGKYEEMLYGNLQTEGINPPLPAEIISELKDEVESMKEENDRLSLEMEMLRENNAEMETKFSLFGENKESIERMEFRPNSESRGTTSAEFSSGLESFLITYSDVVTILLVIFVLFYIVSQVDAKKFSEALSSIQTREVKIQSVNVPLSKEEVKMLARVRELVKDNVDPETLVRSDVKTIIVLLKSSDLFPPGSATLNPNAEKLITQSIKEKIQEGVKQITVDGHTDDVPIKGGVFPSNWELSSARASRVARVIIESTNFPPERMVVTGYGPFRPLKPNTSDLNRALNRRVEIKILKDKNVAKAEQKRAAPAPKVQPANNKSVAAPLVPKAESIPTAPPNIGLNE